MHGKNIALRGVEEKTTGYAVLSSRSNIFLSVRGSAKIARVKRLLAKKNGSAAAMYLVNK